MLACVFFFLMVLRPPRSTQRRSSAASDVYKRQKPVLLERRLLFMEYGDTPLGLKVHHERALPDADHHGGG
mgnify:CR=1 FL=1